MTVQNNIKKSVPGLIKSPIVVLDPYDSPLDISSSYRVIQKNNEDYYIFTNIEREYFYVKDILKRKLMRIIKDRDTLDILDLIIDSSKEGVPIRKLYITMVC